MPPDQEHKQHQQSQSRPIAPKVTIIPRRQGQHSQDKGQGAPKAQAAVYLPSPRQSLTYQLLLLLKELFFLHLKHLNPKNRHGCP